MSSGGLIKRIVDRFFPNYFYKKRKKIFLNTIDFESEVIRRYHSKYNQYLDLKTPKTFYDKVNYLKLHQTFTEEDVKMVDKNTAKLIATDTKYGVKIAKTIATFSTFDQFVKYEKSDDFPSECVVKTNHTSGDVYFVNNKIWRDKYGHKISKRKAFSILRFKLSYNYYYVEFEKCYESIKPCIICEEYLPSLGGLPEYKVFCNYGVPKMVNVVYGRQEGSKVKEAFTDEKLNIFPVNQNQDIIKQEDLFVPKCWNEMLEFAKSVSKKYPMLRVDLLTDGDSFYFCEFTFYDFGGNAFFYPLEWNEKIGELFDIQSFVDNINKRV